jgi:hypothetical protein
VWKIVGPLVVRWMKRMHEMEVEVVSLEKVREIDLNLICRVKLDLVNNGDL